MGSTDNNLTCFEKAHGRCNAVCSKKTVNSFVMVDSEAAEHAVNNLD